MSGSAPETFLHRFGVVTEAPARRWINRNRSQGGIVADSAVVDPSVQVPATALVWPAARVGTHVSIGDHVTIGPGVVLEARVELAFDEPSGRLHIRTLSFLGNRDRVFSAADIQGSSYHGGDFWAGGVAVNAPWVTVRMRGARWPFIVDAQGEFPNRDLGRWLFGGDR